MEVKHVSERVGLYVSAADGALDPFIHHRHSRSNLIHPCDWSHVANTTLCSLTQHLSNQYAVIVLTALWARAQCNLNPVVHSSAEYSHSILIGLISVIDAPVLISAYRTSQYCPDFVSQPYCLRVSWSSWSRGRCVPDAPCFVLDPHPRSFCGSYSFRLLASGGHPSISSCGQLAVVLNPSPQQTKSNSSNSPTAESLLERSLF